MLLRHHPTTPIQVGRDTSAQEFLSQLDNHPKVSQDLETGRPRPKLGLI